MKNNFPLHRFRSLETTFLLVLYLTSKYGKENHAFFLNSSVHIVALLIQSVSISQNHRTAAIGRDLWRLSCPNPLLKLGDLQQIVQDHVHTASEGLQGGRLYNYCSVSVLSHLYSKVFLDF